MHKVTAAIVGIAALLMPSVAGAAPTDVDTTFASASDTPGLFTSAPGGRGSSGRVVAAPDGSLLLVGASGALGASRTTVVKTSSDGALVTSFGGGDGVVTTASGTSAVRGRPLLWSTRIAIADDDGVTSFAADGSDAQHVSIPLGAAGTAEPTAIVADGTGLLVAGAYYDATDYQGAFVARITSAGVVDPSFGTSGHVLVPGFARVTDAVRDGADLLLVGQPQPAAPGPTPDVLRVVRLTGGTTIDTTYGTAGALETTFGAAGFFPGQAILDGDGALLVAGGVTGGENAIAVGRVTGAGAVDAGYGTAGLAKTVFPHNDGEVVSLPAGAIALDGAGRAVVVSTRAVIFGGPFTAAPAVARFTTTGQPDGSFATGGRVLAGVGSGKDQAWYGVHVQAGGRIVFAGQIVTSPTDGAPPAMGLAALKGGALAAGDPPAPTISSPASNGAVGDVVPSFTGTRGTAAGDAASVSVELRPLDGATAGDPLTLPAPTYGAGTWTVQLTAKLPESRYRLTVTQAATDGRSPGSSTIEFKVDRTGPAPTVTQPADGAIVRALDLRGTRGTQADDATQVPDQATVTIERCRKHAAAPDTCDELPASADGPGAWRAQPAGDGTYVVRARQLDDLGNAGRSTARTVKVDSTAPALTVAAPAGGARTGASPAIRGTAGVLADDLDHVADVRTVTLVARQGTTADGPAVTAPVADDGSWQVTWPRALAEGAWTVTATQSDVAPVANQAAVTRAITVDTVAPRVTVTAASLQGLAGVLGTDTGDIADVDLSIRDADDDQVAEPAATISGATWTAAVPDELPDGDYALVVVQRDDVGNTSTLREPLRIEHDRTAPTPSIRLTANSGDLVNWELERGSAPGDKEAVRFRLERIDVPGVVTDQVIALPAPRRFYQGSIDSPPGVYEMEVLQDDVTGNHGSSGKLRFTKTPGGFSGVVKTDPAGSLPAGFAPSREVPTDAAGRVPDVLGDALDVAGDRITRTFKFVTVRLTGRTASESSLGKRPGGGSWRVGDVIAQDPKPGASFTTSLGEEDTARLTFWAGEPGGGGADCRELRRTLRGDDLRAGLAQLRAAKCVPPDIEVRPAKGIADPTIKRADADGDLLVTYPTDPKNLDLVVWKGYGLVSGKNPGPSKEDFALSAGTPNVASLQVLSRGVDESGRPIIPAGARVRFDLHEVGGIDKSAVTDRAGYVAVGGIAPKRPGTIHVQIDWSDAAGERLYGYVAFKVVDRCRSGSFETTIGERWTAKKQDGRCRIEKSGKAARAAGIGDWVAFVSDLLKGVGGKVSELAAAGREGLISAAQSFRAGALQLANGFRAGADAAAAQVRFASSGLWLITPAGVVSAGGGNVVSAGGGNVIAAGGGNVVSAGGGNVISAGGGNVISAGGGNVVSAGGGNIKFLSDGAGVIAAGGGNVIAAGGGNVIAAGGGNVVSAGGGNVVSAGGGN